MNGQQQQSRQNENGFTAADIFSIEALFLGVMLVVVALAFVEALSYQLVSSRTPFVIMVPLLILIAIQAVRLMRGGKKGVLRERISFWASGRHKMLNGVVSVTAWSMALAVAIVVAGHYFAITAFMFALMAFLKKEKVILALLVSGITTAIIFFTFEYGFNIELYRGLIYRYFAGYRVF